jgi:hypothetical protein
MENENDNSTTLNETHANGTFSPFGIKTPKRETTR